MSHNLTQTFKTRAPWVSLLPRSLRDLLDSCPPAGEGVHNWLIRVAVRLHRYIADKDYIADLLRHYSSECGRPVGEDEITNAVDSSEAWLARQRREPNPNRQVRQKPSNPDKQLIESIVKGGPTLDELSVQSPVRWTDGKPHAEEVVSTLFRPEELICVGKTQEYFRTAPVEQWVRLCLLRQMQFIVPSPMCATIGRTKTGKVSAHTLQNTGPRRYLVIEFDSGTTDAHASILWHLAQREPLVLAVHSGGKSIHGWVNVEGRNEEQVSALMDYAVALGADPATRTKSQFVRVPDGMRENGERQRIIYWNPSKLEAK